MSPVAETVSLFSLWKANRSALPPYGECCRLVRLGVIPGAQPAGAGTPVILKDETASALDALRKGE